MSQKKLIIILTICFALSFCCTETTNAAGVIPKMDLISSYSSTGGTPQYKDNDQDLIYKIEQGDELIFSITTSQPNLNYLWEVKQGSQVLESSGGTTIFNWTIPTEQSTWEIEIEVTLKDEVGNTIGRDYISWSITTSDLITVQPGESIQDAIDFLPTEGGIVELNVGTYSINNTIWIKGSINITIAGQGWNTIINGTESGSFDYISIDNSTEIYIKDIYFRSPQDGYIGSSFGRAIHLRESDNCTIDNIKAEQVEGLLNTHFHGYVSYPTVDHLTVNNCYITGCREGIFFNNINHCIIDNLTIQSTTGGSGVAYNIHSTNSILMNSVLSGATSCGVYTYTSTDNITIKNTSVYNNNYEGIQIRASTSNTVENCDIYSNYREGISIITVGTAESTAQIKNNRIYKNSRDGIHFYWVNSEGDASLANNISNNVIFNNTRDGIRINLEQVGITIKNNIVSNNGNYGINQSVNSSNVIDIVYNDFYGNLVGNYTVLNASVLNNLGNNPLFANPSQNDFHLKSLHGRWNGTTFVNDSVTSPCIDSGDPSDDHSNEPDYPNGQINMGAYGNTSYASKGIPPEPEDTVSPYASDYSPAKNATDVSKQTNISLHIQDNDSGVNQSSIQMTVEEETVSPTITGTTSDYTLTYNPPTDFNYNQLVNITIEASDLSSTPNAMNTDIYSFTVQSSPDEDPPTGSILINSGDSQTNSQTASLTISAIDDSDVTEMKISETNDFSSATTETYSTIKSFILSIGDGIKTIYIWFKDTIGNWNTEPYSDSIELDSTGPTISNIQSSVTTNSSTITFTTNELSTSYIEYGLTSNYGSQTENSSQLLTFDFQLSDLSSDTTYHYKIISEDNLSNSSNSTDQTFKTNQSAVPDSTSPGKITDLSSSNITQTSADLSWTSPGDDGNTGTASEYNIRYSTSNITESNWNSAIQISGEPIPQSAGTEQSIYIAVGLSPSTKYYFAIKTSDEVPNTSNISNILSFTTQSSSGGGGGGGTISDTTPPSKPSNFTATGADKQIILKWNNPADSDFVRIKLLRKETSSPASHNDSSAETIYEGTNQEYTDIELNNNTTYHYSIFAYDKKPNYSEVLSISSKPIEGKTSISNGNGNQTYPEGTLIKIPESFKIYIIINQKKKWIPTPEVFETLGYEWTSITEINKTELNNIPNYEDNLIRAIQDYKVYLIVSGIKRHIPNPEIFLNYGFEWNDVKDVNQETINQYSQNLLIKESKQEKVYYLCPERKIRRWLRSPEIFNSYNNKWEDIQVISKYEMEHYKESYLIRQFNNNDIYLIEGDTKRLIKSAEEFNTLGLDWEMVMEVNSIEYEVFSI